MRDSLMRHPTLLLAALASIGAAASSIASTPTAPPAAQGAAVAHGELPRVCSWPPQPQQLVSLDSAGHASSEVDGGLPLPFDTPVPIYTVPSGRWLVLTDFWNLGPAHLLEDHAGSLTFKVGGDIMHFNPRIGVSFPPGSAVVLRNVTSPSGLKSYYFLRGYLAPQSVPDHSWPPPPQNMVVFDSWAQPGVTSGYITVAGTSTLAIYTVPPDRWLVLTDPDVRGTGIELVEVVGSTETVECKSGSYTIGHPPNVGLAFAPGSTVALRNINVAPQPSAQFRMTGYLAPM